MVSLRPFAFLALALALAPSAAAQPTNAEVLGILALRCLAEAPDTVSTFRLALPADTPYLRPALLSRWTDEGRTVYAADTAATRDGALPTLAVTARDVRIAYARAGRGRAARTATLALGYTFTAPDGRLLGERLCRETATDTVPRGALAGLADPAYATTQATLPPGRLRRYVAPVVFTAATAVSALLFFSLRSDG